MTRRNAHESSILAATAALLLASSGAAAYSLNETPDGTPVRWLSGSVTVVLDESLSRLGDVDAVRDAVEAAFGAWIASGALPFELRIVDGECGAAADGTSCVAVEHEPPADNAAADARTFVRFAATSGAIAEADVVLYEEAGSWSDGGEGDDDHDGAIDLRAVVAHEVGHLLGLGHSEVEAARMFPTLAAGSAWDGALADDDVAGATALYEGVEAAVEGAPISCSAAPGRPGAGWSLFALLAALGLVAWRRGRA